MATNGTSYSYLRPSYRGFWIVFGASLVLHFCGIGVYALASRITRPVIDMDQESINVKIVRKGKKRDPKYLPRKVKTAKAAPNEKLLAKDAPPEKKQRDDKIKKALAKIEEERARNKAREDALRKIADNVGEDEPEGDPDGDPYGTVSQAAQMTLQHAYYVKLKGHIKSFYTIPSIISEAERRTLKAVAFIYIGPSGAILRHEISEKSGNDAFNRALEAAIVRASPVPEPPAFMRDIASKGIGLRFSP